MEAAFIIIALTLAWFFMCMRYQAERIALLGKHLAGLQVERHMQTLTQGYLRAIHEPDANRQLQILETFAATERGLAGQVQRLADSMAREPGENTRISRFSMCLPYVERFAVAATRDFRPLLRVHAEGMQVVVDNARGLGPKERAYQLSAELFLLQHSCHWFCKSRTTADTRLVERHQVTYQKVLESVSEGTRQQYRQWLQS